MQEEAILKVFRDTGALLSGHFELRSGLHSDRFFQCANVLCHPREAGTLCAALVEKMCRELSDGVVVDTVVSPAMGGILVGHEIARGLGVRSIFLEKREGVLELHRFKIDKGERFIIAEDVVTRGGRVQETIDVVEKCDGQIIAIALLVDRSGGKAKFNYPTFSLLQMAPVVYEPGACPLCADGVPVVHPGS